MRPIDAQAKIRDAVPLLNAELMAAKLKEYSRFGLPGASMSDGRGGSPPLPMLGNMDRSILVARREYDQALTHAALALDTAVRLQRAFCEPLLTETEKDRKLEDVKSGVPCANVACDRWMTGTQDDRPRHIDGSALCEKCYRYEKRTGKRWTPALEQAEAS